MKKTAYSRFLARAAVMLLAVFSFSGARAQEIVTIGEGTVTSNSNPIGTYYNYSITEQLYTAEEIGMAGTISSVSFYYMGNADKDLPITMYMKHVDEADLASAGITLADAEQVFSGTLSVTATAGWVTITLATPFEYNGKSNLLIGVVKDYLYYFSGQTWQGTATSATMARYTQNDSQAYDTSTVPGTERANRPNIQIGITPSGPVYKKPTDLIVSDLTSTGATISWTAPEGSPTGYAYQYKKASEENWSAEATINATSVTLSDLEAVTAYDFQVKAVYGTAGESAFTATSFTTQISDNMCSITLVLTDSYGDSWNGNSIKIVDALTGIVIGTYANENLNGTQGSGENEANTITAPVPDDRDIRFEWVSGNYADECSYVVYDANGEVIFEGSAAMKESVTYHVECTVTPWHKPTDLAASEIGSRSAVLSWTENSDPAATAWVVAYKADGAADFTEVNVTANPYTLEGLTPETEYTVKVRPATDEAEKWSDEITFTTDVAFPAPTAVAANHVKATKADVSWTGEDDATSFNLRYGATTSITCDFESVVAWSVDDFAPFTAYDGDGASTYSIDEATFTNQGYTGSVITMENGGISDNWSAHSGNKFGCFMDCKTPPNNDFFITPEVTITEGSTFSFWARSLTDDYGLERMKVGVYDGNGTFSSYLAGSADGNVEVPTNWTEYSYDLSAYIGQTIQLAINCVSNDAFALFIDDVSIYMPPTEWNTSITDITTSSYQLEGLTPETTYVVQVQAVYEGGSSTWAPATFTTLAEEDVPFNLQADDVTGTTATLSWDGAQDSYNVRYRRDPVYYFTTFNTDEDRAGWTFSKAIYGTEDTVYNIPEVNNYFLAMGWESTAEDFIYSPELPAYPSGSTLEFYHFYLNEANTFQVGFSTTTNDATEFNWSSPIAATVSYQNGAYTVKYSQTLPDGVKYVAFKATASSQNKSIFIDDFKIYKGASDNEWTETISNVDANTLAVTGLTSDTKYEWQVQGNLTNGTTKWISAFFTTTADIELANDATDNSDIIANNADKVANVTLSDRTLYKDGEWNTICLPFDLVLEGSPLEGATAKTLTNATVTNNGEYTHVELTFGDDVTTLQAGVPYIIKWEAGQENIVDPTFTGVLIKDVDEEVRTLSFADYQVQFIGYYDAFPITSEDEDIFYMTAGNELKHTGIDRTLKSCRAYFQFSEEAQKARQFVLNFGDGSEATGIISTKSSPDSTNDGWYTVDGMKLGKQPKRKGVYIHNGRKVVIK